MRIFNINNNFRTVLIVIISLLCFHSIFAQYEGQFEQLSIKDGLSNNDIRDIVQDQYGYLWIASQDGLNLYDGYNVKIFKNDPDDSTSLPSNNVNAIFEDSSKNIWIGTKEGIAWYNRISNTFNNYQYSTSTLEFANAVLRIKEDSKGNLWISTPDGIKSFDRDKKEFSNYDVMKIDNTVAPFANTGYEILETRKGELYVGGVSYGLMKFDYSSNIFMQLNLKDDGINKLRLNRQFEMIEDSEGNILAASFRGLYKVNPVELSLTDITPFEKIGGADAAFRNAVVGVYIDRNENLWIGTATHGIYVYHTSLNKYQHIINTSSPHWYGAPIYEDKFGVVWISSAIGIFKYDFDKKPFELIKPADYVDAENEPVILSFSNSDKLKRKLWLGSSGGLFQYDMDKNIIVTNSQLLNKINNLYQSGISSLTEKGNQLWIGTFNSGLFSLDIPNNNIKNYSAHFYDNTSINNNYIYSLLNTGDGNIWVGTDFGINIIDENSNVVNSVPSFMSRKYNLDLKNLLSDLHSNSQPLSSILGVGDYQDMAKDFVLTKDENVIISSIGEGLDQWNMVDYGWIESSDGDTLWSAADFYSTFHAGGGAKNRIKMGMMKLKKGRYRLRYVSDDSHSVESYNDKPPQDSLNWGIVMFSLDDQSFSKYEAILNRDHSTSHLNGESIRILTLASDNSIWAGTNVGVSKINPETFEVTNYRHDGKNANSLSNDRINGIREDLNGNIWIATTDGLNKYDPRTDSFTILREKDGLPSNHIRAIEIDDSGDIWVGSLNGISKIEISANITNPVIINYDVNDGLQGYEFFSFASLKDSDGRLYFSGRDGFNRFLPGQSNNTLPFVAINNIMISNKPINEIDDQLTDTHINDISELTLSYDKNDLSFEFASIHYSRPDKNRVMYKMEGVDTEWQQGTRRFATYTNLDPGDYKFLIKGSNGDGIWNETAKAIIIHISPPWYNNWVAYTVYAFLFAGLLFSVRRVELSRRTRLAQLKETRFRAQAAELKAKAAEAENKLLEAEFNQKKKELEEARDLQLSMLPRELPQLPNLDIAVYMKTATEVGGDYYDFHVGMDGALTVVLGDATGHGMKAGTMVTTTKSLFNVLAPNPDIVATFHEMTRCLKLMHLEKLSMCMTMLKIMGNRIQMSAAGMPPVFIYKKDGAVMEEHIMKGMPLGTMTDFPYVIKESELHSGDTILLMSDGFPELLNDQNEVFGYKRARNLFEELAGNSPEEIISSLKDEGLKWTQDADPDDDVTFIVIKAK